MSASPLHIVLSTPPKGINDQTFEAFHTRHLQDVLTVPGFDTGRFYSVRERGGSSTFPYRFLALYEMTGDVWAAHDRLMATAEAAPDRIYMPDWFDKIMYASWYANWNGSPTGSGPADILSAPALRVSLALEQHADGYELHQSDDPNAGLPPYRWAGIEIADHLDEPAAPPRDGISELWSSAIGPLWQGAQHADLGDVK